MTPSNDHSTRGSFFADAAAAQRAVSLALPAIEAAIVDPAVCGSGFLYIVVMDPGLTPDRTHFAAAVLHEHAIGDRDRWDADYRAFALAKAELSWRRGLDGHAVQSALPHSVRAGESLLWGGVCLDGIVVGVSGAEAEYDEAFALAIAGFLRAIAKAEHRAARAAGLWEAGARTGR